MDSKKYSWIQSGWAKHIDPAVAVAELERIETAFGAITAEAVLKASESEDALFHKLFTWDDEKAAHHYRLSQARQIINNIEVVVVSDGRERTIPVFEIVKTEVGKVYKSVSDFSSEDILQVRTAAAKALNFWKNKLSAYAGFEKQTDKITEVISDLSDNGEERK